MRRLPALAPLSLPLLLAACLGGGNSGDGISAFISFDDIDANSVVDVPSQTAVNYNGAFAAGEIDATNEEETGSSTIRLTYDENSDVSAVRLTNTFPVRGTVVTTFSDAPVDDGTNNELLRATRVEGVTPADRAWIYQGDNGNLPFTYMTFGIWELGIGGDTDLGGAAWGSPSAAATVAGRAGAVAYTGRLLGTQIQAGVSASGPYRMLEADATVTADFDANTVSLASANTQLLGVPGAIGLDIVTDTPADIAGNSFGANGIIRISGAEGSTEGQFGGQFFGPAADEVGGWFNVENTDVGNNDRYFGSFGAVSP